MATDVPICSDLSADILRRGGSAVDATITALVCVGAVHPESSGIGGGGFMVVRHTNGSVFAINFRETAPSASTVDMFHSNKKLSKLVRIITSVLMLCLQEQCTWGRQECALGREGGEI